MQFGLVFIRKVHERHSSAGFNIRLRAANCEASMCLQSSPTKLNAHPTPRLRHEENIIKIYIIYRSLIIICLIVRNMITRTSSFLLDFFFKNKNH